MSTTAKIPVSTEVIDAKVALKAPLASPALTGTPTAPTADAGTNTTQIATTAFVEGEIASKAPLASPALTGTPTAPTAAADTNTTQIATTAFVQGELSAHGLDANGVQISNADDLDNITTTGWYYWSTTVPSNSPTPYGYGSMYVDHAGSNVKQTVFRDNKEYTRNKYGPNAWPAWHEVDTTSLAADLVLHVNSVSGDDSNDGLTAANPKRTISGAMNAIPHAVAGRSVTIRLAEGAYQNGSVLTISGWNGLDLTIGKEPSATTANIQVGMIKMESNANCTFYFADFKLTGYIQNFSTNKSGSFWANRLLCDGGVIDTRGGWSLISLCTFRNISGTTSAISVTEGYCSIEGTAIENTCSYGVKANVNGIVSFSLYNNGTYPPKNEATTPYYIVYSGRIFVGGRTYQESPVTVGLLTLSPQVEVTTGYTATLSESYTSFRFLEFVFSSGSNTSTYSVLLVPVDALALNANYSIGMSGTTPATVKIGYVSGSTTQVGIISTTAGHLYLAAIKGHPN